MMIEKMQSLEQLVEKELKEQVIASEGSRLLQELRTSWKNDKHLFSEGEIATLKKLSEKHAAVLEFIEEEESFENIRTTKELDEAIARLYLIVRRLEGTNVVVRISKEIRELRSLSTTLRH